MLLTSDPSILEPSLSSIKSTELLILRCADKISFLKIIESSFRIIDLISFDELKEAAVTLKK